MGGQQNMETSGRQKGRTLLKKSADIKHLKNIYQTNEHNELYMGKTNAEPQFYILCLLPFVICTENKLLFTKKKKITQPALKIKEANI